MERKRGYGENGTKDKVNRKGRENKRKYKRRKREKTKEKKGLRKGNRIERE